MGLINKPDCDKFKFRNALDGYFDFLQSSMRKKPEAQPTRVLHLFPKALFSLNISMAFKGGSFF